MAGSTRLLVVVPIMLVLAGCKSMAERDFETRHPECSEVSVTETKQGDYWRTRATGCGKSEDRISWDHGNWVQPADARKEAAFLTGCPISELSYEVLTRATIGVAGCGHKLVYKAIGTRWVLNSDSNVSATTP